MGNGTPFSFGGRNSTSVWRSILVRLLVIGTLPTVELSTLTHAADHSLTQTRFNELQLIASHNSFKQAIDPPLLEMMLTLSAKAAALDYSHVSLTEQLNLGLRGLEIDIVNDPDGGLYAHPLGLKMLQQLKAEAQPYDTQAMLNPGFKVMHVPDFDFRSNQPTLAGVLAELRAWSIANPGHLPIFISSNLTDTAAPAPGAVQPAPFDQQSLDLLDQALREGLGADRLITPDMVRREHPTLRQAILADGWPLTQRLLGKFMWVLDAKQQKRLLYTKGHPSLRGRVMFTLAPPESDEAAVLFINNPLNNEARIRKLVDLGYFVRTRADSATREARTGDTRRFEAALKSRAQVISTDYYRPDPRFKIGYQVQFDDGSYYRRLPLYDSD